MIRNLNGLPTRIISLLLVLVLLLGSLSSCFRKQSTPSKEEIQESISESKKSRDYAYQYLLDWGMPSFDYIKFLVFEQKIKTEYNFSALPDTREHAKQAAEDFLENYYSKINLSNKTEVTDALLTCFVAALGDPYSLYRPPLATENYNTDMQGEFGGIGVMIEYNSKEGTLTISSPIPGSPAEKVGIMSGDVIVGVDGTKVSDVGYEAALNLIRGKIGTTVKITVLRGDTTLDFTLVRELVKETSVAYTIDDETNIGYVQIVSFKNNTFAQFKEAIDALEAAGVAGIIFDLRNNTGGYVHSVCDMVSYLIPDGHTIVSYQYKGKDMTYVKSKDEGEDHVVDLPMAVLCNAMTASSAEIFTSAIRDYRNSGLLSAVIVGTTTYKKGIMQASYGYSDGSSVTLTIAFYYPPCGVNYHGVGITPDVYIELPTPEKDEDGNYLPVEDTQLDGAFSELQKLINAN